MRFISTQVESAVLRRLKLLKRLQDVELSPEEGLGLLQRLETNSGRPDDYEVLMQVIRAATEVSAQLCAEWPLPERKATRNRQAAQASRRRSRR